MQNMKIEMFTGRVVENGGCILIVKRVGDPLEREYAFTRLSECRNFIAEMLLEKDPIIKVAPSDEKKLRQVSRPRNSKDTT